MEILQMPKISYTLWLSAIVIYKPGDILALLPSSDILQGTA